jgi:hypothetical protein
VTKSHEEEKGEEEEEVEVGEVHPFQESSVKASK